MAHDVELAGRVRAMLATEPDLAEKAMFGGLAFLVGGSMAVAVGGRGGLMLRVEPEQQEQLLREEPAASPTVMRGRALDGWLDVEVDAGTDDAALQRWVDRGVARARALQDS